MEKYLLENYEVKEGENLNKYQKLFTGEPWIIKPSRGFAGKGIEIVTSFSKFTQYFQKIDTKVKFINKGNQYALQRYVTNPMLYKGHKFHLRYHFTVSKERFVPMELAQVITAGEKFKLGDFGNRKTHDTHAENSIKGVYFPDSFDITKKESEKVMSSISEITEKCVELIDKRCWSDTRHCYQTFGMDLMILQDFQVKLLEVNVKIGLKMGEQNYPGSSKTYNEILFQNELDYFVKPIFPQK